MLRLEDIIPKAEGETLSPKKTFKDYEPGFVHIDIKYLPQMPDETSRRYLFVAINRAARWVFLHIYGDMTDKCSVDFLRRLKIASPIKITKIPTDNGSQFTDRFSMKDKTPSGQHVFGYGRETQTQTTIDVPYTASVSYNAETGRVATQTYPNGLSVTYGYTSLGYLNDVHNTSTLATYWTANGMDPENHLLQATYGNNIVIKQVFDAATGFVRTIQAGPNNGVQDLSFDYDTVGNVTFRSDRIQNLSESFYYQDGVNRLTTAALTSSGAGTLQQTYSYYDNGNIKTRSTVGAYHYGATNAQPHALTSVELSAGGTINYGYDPNGNLSAEIYKDAAGAVIATKGRTEAYTSSNMPLKLAAQGGIALNYVYGPEHQRSKLTSNTGTIIYLNPNQEGGLLYEKETKGNSVEHRNFITANGEVIALVKQIGSAATTSYLHRDNLGSTTAVTNEAAQVVEQLSYEPFGKRRFPTGSSDADNKIVGVTTARGFTDHEHLESLELIHMNGRVFDPVLGRFMSADPNVPEPSDMQSYNRYSYVRNNPLTYEDMTGFWDGVWNPLAAFASLKSHTTSVSSDTPSVADTAKTSAGGSGTLAKQVDASNNGSVNSANSGFSLDGYLKETGRKLLDDFVKNNSPDSEYKDRFQFTWLAKQLEGTYQKPDSASVNGMAASVTAIGATLLIPGGGEVNAVREAEAAKALAHSKEFSGALSKAVSWLEQKGFNAEKETMGKFGNAGKPVGMQTADGKVGFRVEYDERNGAHINVWAGKEKGPHFTFDASKETVDRIHKLFQ